MKPSAFFLLSAVFLASGAARGASFEGKMVLDRSEPPEPPHTIIYSVKEERNRIEVLQDGFIKTFMTDTAKKQTTVILEDERKYLYMPSLAPLPDEPPLEKADGTIKLFGYTAQKYVYESDTGATELWLVEGLGKYTGFGEGFARPPKHVPMVDVPEPPPPRDWEYALAGTDFFPLRVITRNAAGREIFRLEVKEVTPQAVDDRVFTPSTNYKKVETWPKYEEV